MCSQWNASTRIKFHFCALILGREKQLEDHNQPENTPDFPGKIIIYFILVTLVEKLQDLWDSQYYKNMYLTHSNAVHTSLGPC